MKPGHLPVRAGSRPMCQWCGYIVQQPGYRHSFLTASIIKAPAIRRQPARPHAALRPIATKRSAAPPRKPAPQKQKQKQPGQEIVPPLQKPERTDSLNVKLRKVEKQIEWIKTSPNVESEEAALEALEELEDIAGELNDIRTQRIRPPKARILHSSASAILSLDSDTAVEEDSTSIPPNPEDLPTPAYLSQLAEDLVKHSKVFISPAVLSAYIDVQRTLGRPRAIPEILYLYAHKPIPVLGSSPPKYTEPNPKAAKQAVPRDIAEKALDAAIEVKDLPLALGVIDYTYRAPAWRRHMILTKIGPPGLAMGIMPFAVYMLAQEVSVYSGFMDPVLFKWYAFAGIGTYVACCGTIGFVALTTANDDFDRVVWRPGIALTERWLRQDERTALDKVAAAWGFKESWRKGDEDGPEWEGLRLHILMRGMILDKSDLMEGMNPR
ncbi:hypothetical protein P154DRAFT_520565 [Amniculicola lignicola CBS 123094]|uniref:Uncharacterized protein n=1 Tax=Amniculicola lignicola CBS 123094 TaxID=1392246 RepID=A0A6A5WMR1_9PLEO|nr:hypothetical protein P154DRAFT_520565 [Amniculicola lignicola CBS 123094]